MKGVQGGDRHSEWREVVSTCGVGEAMRLPGAFVKITSGSKAWRRTDGTKLERTFQAAQRRSKLFYRQSSALRKFKGSEVIQAREEKRHLYGGAIWKC